MKQRPSRTAEYVTWLRALELYRKPPVLQDEIAHRFLHKPLQWSRSLGRITRRSKGWTGLSAYIVGRHAWMDDRLTQALEHTEHVLILGAGYDTRAHRFGSATYWEVDHPATARRKRAIAPDHPAVRVDVDFEVHVLSNKLKEAGFPVGARTFIIWEGVTMYLTRSAFLDTLTQLDTLVGPGSALVLDALRPSDGSRWLDHMHRLWAALMPLVGEPVTLQPHPDDMKVWLDDHGWTVQDIVSSSELQAERSPSRLVFPPAYLLHATR